MPEEGVNIFLFQIGYQQRTFHSRFFQIEGISLQCACCIFLGVGIAQEEQKTFLWNVFFDDVDEGEECYYEDTFLLKDNIDQIQNVIDEIKINPDSRRLIVSAWNVSEISRMALPPCHTMFQFYVINGRLSCQLYQRSADAFLGVPFNIASYALLTMMIAQVCDLEVGEFIHTFGDAHIYTNHIEQVKEQLNREPLELPTLKINLTIKNIDDFKMSDFELINYSSHDAIKAEMAI